MFAYYGAQNRERRIAVLTPLRPSQCTRFSFINSELETPYVQDTDRDHRVPVSFRTVCPAGPRGRLDLDFITGAGQIRYADGSAEFLELLDAAYRSAALGGQAVAVTTLYNDGPL